MHLFKRRPQKAAMENIQATHPLHLVHFVYLTIEAMEAGQDVHVLIITDHFYVVCTGSGNIMQTAKHTTQALWDQFVVHCGPPDSIEGSQQDVNRPQNCILAVSDDGVPETQGSR